MRFSPIQISAAVAAVSTVVRAIPTTGASAVGVTTEKIVDLPAVNTDEIITSEDPPPAGEIDIPEVLVGYVWEYPLQGGAAATVFVPYLHSSCMTMGPEWNNRISSIYMKAGYICYWYTDENCREGGGSTGGPDDILISSLTSYYDDNISSYGCDYYWR